MRVVIFGATGMIGRGVALECLDDDRVTSVLLVGRGAAGLTHPKLREIQRENMLDFGTLASDFSGLDACFYCIGATSAGRSEAEYRAVTLDVTVAAAKVLRAESPQLIFCFISGQGSDSSEHGPIMWARVKGAAENAVLASNFRGAYIFRPGIVQPRRGVRSRTALYRVLYVVGAPLMPLLRLVAPGVVTTTAVIGRAMINLAAGAHAPAILGNHEINLVAAQQPHPVPE